MQRAKSKLCLELLYFSLSVKKVSVFCTFHWPWRSDFCWHKAVKTIHRNQGAGLGFRDGLFWHTGSKPQLQRATLLSAVIIPVKFIQQEPVQHYPRDPPTRSSPVKVLILKM